MKTFKYQSRNASGAVCCAGNTPDYPRCQSCKAKAGGPSPMKAASAFRTIGPAGINHACPVHGKARAATPAEPVRKTDTEWLKHFAVELGVPVASLTTVEHVAAPPDAYGPSIAARHEAEATPESTFRKQYAADRMREFSEEYARADARRAEHRPTPITAIDCTPPDPYRIALDARKREMR